MGAVDVTVEEDGTVRQTGLVAAALDVLQPDLSAPGAEHRAVQGRFRQAASHLQAHHVGLAQVPAVVAHRPPLVVAEHLHPAGAPVVPVHQPDPTWGPESQDEPPTDIIRSSPGLWKHWVRIQMVHISP